MGKKPGIVISLFGMMLVIFGLMAPTSVAEEVNTSANENTKVFVCKYVTTPDGIERLQTGDNPISTSINSIPLPPEEVVPGAEFHDAQGRSLVIAFDTGQEPEPTAEDCPPPNGGTTTTTSTTIPTTTSTSSTSTTSTSTTSTSTTSTTAPTTSTSTTEPPVITPFAFGAAVTECQAEVPVILITFANTFPELAGDVGLLEIFALSDDSFVGDVEIIYEPNTTVEVIYPGAEVDAAGNIIDLPGWNLNANGLWVLDESDAFLREGLHLEYTVNPTATADVTYPPASSLCADPPPPGPTTTTTTIPGQTTTTLLRANPPRSLPRTGGDNLALIWFGAGLVALGFGASTSSKKISEIR